MRKTFWTAYRLPSVLQQVYKGVGTSLPPNNIKNQEPPILTIDCLSKNAQGEWVDTFFSLNLAGTERTETTTAAAAQTSGEDQILGEQLPSLLRELHQRLGLTNDFCPGPQDCQNQ